MGREALPARATVPPDRPPVGPGDGHLLDYLHGLLSWSDHHPDVRRWAQLRADEADALEAIRASAADGAPEMSVAGNAAGPVSRHLSAAAATVTCHPLVLAAGVARAVDDLYVRPLLASWRDRVAANDGRIDPGDLVIVPGDQHLEAVYGTASRSVGPGRAADHPARTAHCRLFAPGTGVPPVVLDMSLDGQLQEVMVGPRPLVTVHPNRSTDELSLRAFPAAPRDPGAHLEVSVALVERGLALGAAVVALPELAGTPPVMDALRRLRPEEPTLLVAGSAHVTSGRRRVNAAHLWVARRRWVVPGARPLRILKRVPYEGVLGREPLTELADEIRVFGSDPWRLAVGICRDALDDDVVHALGQLGVNLLVVPACSAKTSNLGEATATLATGVPGIGLVANGPRYFAGRPDEAGTPTSVDVPLGIYCSPLERVEPRLIERCDPPGICVFETGAHASRAEPP